MTDYDPIELLFGGMGKLGPGSDAATLHVLRRLPKARFDLVVDAGCGAGRQTLVLAQELGTPVHAIDVHEPFLHELKRRAALAGIDALVHAQRMDMKDIPEAFSNIDLLWCEGAVYNIGFARALTTWAPAVRPGGFVVVSELTWLTERIPDAARDFFRQAYPDMKQSAQNIAIAEGAGYRVLDTCTLPREAWVDGYYDVLEPRAIALAGHPDISVRQFARETLREVEVFQSSEDSFGYVIYALQRP